MGLAVIGCGPQKSLSPIHSAHSFRSSLTPDSHELRGLASYYGRKFHGRRTASGEKYRRQQLTAAHTDGSPQNDSLWDDGEGH